MSILTVILKVPLGHLCRKSAPKRETFVKIKLSGHLKEPQMSPKRGTFVKFWAPTAFFRALPVIPSPEEHANRKRARVASNIFTSFLFLSVLFSSCLFWTRLFSSLLFSLFSPSSFLSLSLSVSLSLSLSLSPLI